MELNMSAATDTSRPIRFTPNEAKELSRRFRDASAEELLTWALPRFGNQLVIASSFSVEDIALIDIAAEIDSSVRVFTLDTGRLHEETYETLERVRNQLGVGIEVLFPDRDAVEELILEKGPNSFYESVANRRECCRIRKVEPLRRILRTADAWVTGLRREQATSRTELDKVQLDMLNGGLVKLNPLADWTSEDVWNRIRSRNLPYNPLHDQGFPSIGCEPCTRAVKPGEDERAGRWWWERPDGKECGLHK